MDTLPRRNRHRRWLRRAGYLGPTHGGARFHGEGPTPEGQYRHDARFLSRQRFVRGHRETRRRTRCAVQDISGVENGVGPKGRGCFACDQVGPS
eukprot:6213335-Pleurochrysis_carterae.AAC.2